MEDFGVTAYAVKKSLDAAKLDERDAAARALVERYAALIDNATVARKYEKHLDVLKRAARNLDLDAADEAYDVVENALAAHSVASDLGPKFLAALTSLGLTPAARGGGKVEDPGKLTTEHAAVNELQQAAEKRRKRAQG